MEKDTEKILDKDWLQTELGWCGCWDNDAVALFRDFLRWADNLQADRVGQWLTSPDKKESLFSYLLAGICERLELIEHGTAVRFPWTTEKGKKVLAMLNAVEDIDAWMSEDVD